MSHTPFVLPLADCHDNHVVGGKAINLSHLINAGLPVPGGFVVTTHAFKFARGKSDPPGLPPDVCQQVVNEYHRMASPAVAVRSSATAEDMAGASMAGQYETFLDVRGDEALIDAIGKCWASLDTPRARAYLEEKGIPISEVAMAVVVQELIPADVAGVLFTANPRIGSRAEMVIDASYGLGEAVVSGLIQPDTLIVERLTGAIKQATIGSKESWIQPGARHFQPVPEEWRQRACLNARQVRDLWKLGVRVMEHFGSAQDIEWAIRGDRVYLLQSRAITTLEDAEAYGTCLARAREQLRQAKREGRGDWVRHNISETLPHPTPLTWSVVRRFMSGDGGFGAMYRMVGFEPSPAAVRDGFLDLIAGRIYMDLSRGPEMFFEGLPYRYDLNLLRLDPDAAQGAPTLPAGSALELFKSASKLARTTAKLRELATDFDRKLTGDIIPEFTAWVRTEKQRDLAALTTEQWLELWRSREERVMSDFAPCSLLPSLIGAMALADLRTFCAENFWDEDADSLSNLLACGAEPDSTLRSAQGLHDIAAGSRAVADWLAEFGHRAPAEFDLATPRWRERPDAVATMAGHLRDSASPLAQHQRRVEAGWQQFEALEKNLSGKLRAEFRERVSLARRYLRFREDGKYSLILGYDLLRDLALEAGRRLQIGDDVFLLTLEELRDALATGFAPLHLIDQRHLERTAQARVFLPHVITDDEIETLGQPVALPGGDRITAFPICGGACTGPARIVFSPTEAGDLGKGYILVCPSTDPNWTPLFVNAAGLIIERGGTLSHGAVVAREMGLPAVVLDGATRIFSDGEVISIDGNAGAVLRSGAFAAAPTADPNNIQIPTSLVPPPSGTKEKASARLRNIFVLIWGLYLAAAFLLPRQYVWDPSMDVLDCMLWPIARDLGRPAVVIVVALVLAAFSMIGQRFLTDNRRLLLAKDRANRLKTEASKLPPDSPRRRAMLALAGPVQTRVMMASFVPLALILGPMVMTFAWFPERVDPASWNAPGGAMVFVTAHVDGEFTKPVTIVFDPHLTLDASAAAMQSLPPIRATLEKLLAQWQQPSAPVPNLPWDLRAAAAKTREEMLGDLEAYLKRPVPAGDLAWVFHTLPNESGRYPISVSTENAKPLSIYAVLGNQFPPEPHENLGDKKGMVQSVRSEAGTSPVRYLTVTYKGAQTTESPSFWRPFERFGSSWSVSWLLTYIAVYLPAMFLFRWILRIP